MKTISYAGIAVILISIGAPFSATSLNAEMKEKKNEKACQQEITLEEFRAIGLGKSPLVADIDRAYSDEIAKAFDTEVLSNPDVQIEQTFTRMKLGGADDSQSQVSIGQPLRLSNFGQREKVATLIRSVGDRDKKAKLLELSLRLRVQFYTLAMLQQSERIIADASARTVKKIALVREGVKKGLLSAGEEKLFEGEKYRLEAQISGLAASIANLQRELSRSIGVPCPIIALNQNDITPIPSPEELLKRASSSLLGERVRIDLMQRMAQEHVRLAELDAIPQVSPRMVYQHTNDGGDFLGVGITLPLPFWNRNQGERARAVAERQVAERESLFLESGGLEAQVSLLWRFAVSSQEQSEMYFSKVIPSFAAALRAQERLYSDGKGSVLQVWQTQRAYIDTELQGWMLWLEAISTRVQLSLLIGEEI